MKIIVFILAICLAYFIIDYLLNIYVYNIARPIYIKLLIATGITLVGGLLLLGLPGIIMLGVSSPFIEWIWGVKDFGDSAWPLGAIITIVYPMVIIPAYYLSFCKLSAGTFLQIIAFIFALLIGGIITSIFVYAITGKHV